MVSNDEKRCSKSFECFIAASLFLSFDELFAELKRNYQLRKELEFCDHYLIIKFDLLYVLKYKGNYGKLIELMNEVREECEMKNLPNQQLKCLSFLVGTACIIDTFDIHFKLNDTLRSNL